MLRKFRIVISLLILSIVIFTTYNAYDLSTKNNENIYNRLIQDLYQDTTDFTTWLERKKEIVDTARDFVDNFSIDEVIARSTMNPYLNINNDDQNISQIYIGLADGEFITGGEWIPPEDYDPTSRVWYREAVQADETIISDVYIDRETGDRTVTISSPLYMENGFAGVIAADVFMEDISRWLTDEINRKNIYTYLLDGDGTVILHTLRSGIVGSNIYEDDEFYETFFARKQTFLDFFEEVKHSGQSVRMEYIASGKKTLGIIQQIDDSDWYLAVASYENNDIRNFINMNRRTITFNVLSLVVVLILLRLIINIKNELLQKNQLLTLDNQRDFLTGIYNRRYFNLYMERLWKSSADVTVVSLLMLDIDYFKGYNDTYGHIEGDEVLKSVTRVIENSIRREDVFARYGGEEFTVLLQQVMKEDAEKVAEKIITAVREMNVENIASPLGRITLSIGVASVEPGSSMGVREFSNAADQELYKAKEAGRDRVSASDGIDESTA